MPSTLAILVSVAALLTSATDARAQDQRPRSGSIAEAERALSAGESERALKLAAGHLARNPRDAGAQLLIVRAHVERGEWEPAYRMASRAARAHPSNVDVLYYLGLVTRELAAGEFDRLVRIAPDSARVHQLQAEQHEAGHRSADAEREYAAALASKPDLLEALLGLAALQRGRLACDEAIQQYERAEAIRPTFEGAYGLGVCHSLLQREDEAVKHFEAALRRNASAGEAWLGLGNSLVRLGRTAEGIEKLQRAAALQPRSHEAFYALGLAYRASGDDARARAAFAKAQELRLH